MTVMHQPPLPSDVAPPEAIRPADVALELGATYPSSAAQAELAAAAAELEAWLARTGRTLGVHVWHVEHAATPVVRVDGHDVDLQTDATGRFRWRGETFDHPPAGMVVEAVKRELATRTALRRHAALARPGIPDPDDPSRASRVTSSPGDGSDAVEALRWALRGDVVTRGDAGWAEVTGAFNVLVRQEPDLVALPADAEDVVTVVRHARQHGLQVVPQRTGHNAAPLGSLAGTVLLRTDRMRTVRIDPDRCLAVVEAGARWEDLVPLASELGLAALHGSTPDVSVVGYSLGGGVGWYGRALGLSADAVTGLQVVTADGHLRWVDHDHEPELFWALRGGGGSFGVVTAVELKLFRIPEVYAGLLFFPPERAAEVLRAWHAWTATAPEEVTSVGRILTFPPLPDVPEPLRGQTFAILEAIAIGPREQADEALAPLRALGPVMDTFAVTPPVGIAELHMDPRDPLPYASEHLLLDHLTGEAIDALVAAVGPGAEHVPAAIEIRHLGGALGREAPGHGALARMPGEYLLLGIDAAPTEEAAVRAEAALARMVAAVGELGSGRYLNFTEVAADPAAFYPREVHARLQAVRRAVDPDGLFRANHPIR